MVLTNINLNILQETEADIRLSVVMGTYNRLDVLKKSVMAILNSPNLYNIELVVNDAGSTDGSIEWLTNLKKIDNRLVLILSGKRTTITQAYNECFKIAKGKYITWLSDDIIPIANALQKMCDMMDTLNKGDLGGFYYTKVTDPVPRMPKIAGFYEPSIACVHNSTLKEMNYWNTDYPHYGQETEFSSRILRLGGKIVPCEGAVVHHLELHDELRNNNIVKLNEGHSTQMYCIICHKRYGIRAESQYPVILVLPYDRTDKDFTKKVISVIYKYLKNIICVLPNTDFATYIVENSENTNIKFTDSYTSECWNDYDLIVEIKNGKAVIKDSVGQPISFDMIGFLLKEF